MSDLVLLGFGLAVFFITVYGVVVLSGLGLSKKQILEQPEFRDNVDERDLEGLPTNIDY